MLETPIKFHELEGASIFNQNHGGGHFSTKPFGGINILRAKNWNLPPTSNNLWIVLNIIIHLVLNIIIVICY